MKRMWNKLVTLFWFADPAVARISVAVSSILFAILLAIPGDTMSLPVYHLMEKTASEEAWTVMFGLYGVCAFHLTLCSTCKNYLNAVITLFGCILWSYSAVAIILGIYPLTAAMSSHIVLSALSWWVLVRTEIRNKV